MQSIRISVFQNVKRSWSFTKWSIPQKRPQPMLCCCSRHQSTEPLVKPQSEGEPKTYPPKLEKIVQDISHLTLLEVSELNELLKKTLNLPDTPVMAIGAMPNTAPVSQEEEEEVAPKAIQTSFTVKLLKFDDTRKVALIKEVKSLLEGMNLVQAKKFVESAPTVVKADMPKDDAEKLSEALSKAGAVCEII